MPGVLPPAFLHQGVSSGYGLGFGFREIEEWPEFFLKEEDFSHERSLVDSDHFGDQEVVLCGPAVHMFEQAPFHLPEFFPVQGPAVSLEVLRNWIKPLLR